MLLIMSLIALTLPRATTVELDPPAPIRFLKASKIEDGVRLTLELMNTACQPVKLLGYREGSVDLPKEYIEPLWFAETGRDGERETLADNWPSCGYGFGLYELSTNAKITFEVQLPEGKWEQVYIRTLGIIRNPVSGAGQRMDFTSNAITRRQVEKSMTATETPPARK